MQSAVQRSPAAVPCDSRTVAKARQASELRRETGEFGRETGEFGNAHASAGRASLRAAGAQTSSRCRRALGVGGAGALGRCDAAVVRPSVMTALDRPDSLIGSILTERYQLTRKIG